MSTTIDQDEVDKFSKIADEWWDPNGKFKPLHLINPIRLKYFKEKILDHFSITDSEYPYYNLNVLDIGCGGGLVSIPFARLKANVTAIDASEKNIKVAKNYAAKLKVDVNFIHSTIEEFVSEPFDVILALEILEHVANIETFIFNINRLLKKNGLIIISTINRNLLSYFSAIMAAEYILKWVPIGTHEYRKFLKPSEIMHYLRANNLEIKEMKGLNFNPLNWQWSLSDNIKVNYFMIIKRKN